MPRRILALLGFECVAACVCAAYPFAGTIFLLLLTFIRPQDDRPNMNALHYSGVIMASTILGTLARFYVVQPRVFQTLRGLLPMLLMWAALWFSAINSGYNPTSAYVVSDFLVLTVFCGLLGLWLDTPARLTIAVGGILVSAFYIVQMVARHPRTIHEEIGGEAFERLGYRNMTNWGDPNFQALLMVLAIFLALSIFAADLKRWMRAAIFFSLFGFLYVFLKDASRGATIALVVAFPVFWLLQKHKALIGGSFMVFILLGFAFFATQSYMDRLVTIFHYQNDSSATSRLELWNIAINLIQTHPLTGVGPGNFQLYAFNSQHNSYLQCASEMGILGALIYVGCLLSGLYSAISARKLASEKHKNIPVLFSLSGGLTASIVAIIIQGFFTGFAYREFVYTILILSFIARQQAKAGIGAAAVVGAPSPVQAVGSYVNSQPVVAYARGSVTQAQVALRRLRASR
jgi:O-antigen ligase